MNRQGAALILAMVILAALLLLGLPFLFNQSASLTGTKSLAHNQAAHIGEKTAEQLAIAIAADAMSNHFAPTPNPPPATPPQPWTSFYDDLNLLYPAPYQVPFFFREMLPIGQRLNRIGLNLTPVASAAPAATDVPGLGFNAAGPSDAAVLGAAIEDESGKFDPNYLGIKGWAALLAQVGVYDVDSPADVDADGELATTLARLRANPAYCPTGRIETLDVLLLPTPQAPRPNLLRSELDLLRPFLTIHSRGQGRGGLIDLGTMLTLQAPDPNAGEDGWLDSASPVDLLDFPHPPGQIGSGLLYGADTHIYSRDPNPANTTLRYGQCRSVTLLSQTMDGQSPLPGGAVFIDAPPVVNVNQARMQVLQSYEGMQPPLDVTPPTPPAPPVLSPLGIIYLDNTAKLVDRVLSSSNLLSSLLGIYKTGFDYQRPVAAVDEIASGTPLPTDPGEGAGPGPFQDINNDPILAANASTIKLTGGNIMDFPPSGYAVIISASLGFQETITYSSRDSGKLGGVGRISNPRDWSLGAGHDVRVIGIGPYEMPPLAIASTGVVTVEGGATVAKNVALDTSRQMIDAQQVRRIVAQAVPQEEMLEARWTTQADYHALIASRHGSLVAALPKPTNRLRWQSGTEPVAVADITSNVLDELNGMRPATLRSLTRATHLPTDWRADFVGEITNFFDAVSISAPRKNPSPAVYDETGLGVEGMILQSGKRLSYPWNSETTGFFTQDLKTATDVMQPIHGRQFSCWVKPTADWSGRVPIFEARMPVANAAERLSGTLGAAGSAKDEREPGDNTLQNYFRLEYDSDAKTLVLHLENGSVEFLSDYGPKIPRETFTVPSAALPTIDPQSRGGDDPSEPNPLFAAQPLHSIQQRYYVGPRGMETDTWYLVQVAFASNLPGGMMIAVNGIVGRDLDRITSGNVTPQAGDHYSLPCLILKQALAAKDISITGSSGLLEPEIVIDAYYPGAGETIETGHNAVSKILPKRGMVRIGDEYIRYDNILAAPGNLAKLVNCVRARRQDTYQGSPSQADWWPSVPAHAIGDWVYPGGYRLVPPADTTFTPPWGRLYQGGCALTTQFEHGAIAPDYLVQSQLVQAPDVIDNGGGSYTLPATAARITVQDTSQFPDHGIIKVGPNYIVAYESKTGTQLNLVGLETYDVRWSGNDLGATKFPDRVAYSWTGGMPMVTLISMEVGGANPVQANRYPLNGLMMLQLQDPTTRRVEWTAYTHIVDSTKGFCYFMNDQGFTASRRGLCRTEFNLSIPNFPVGSRVMPVQGELLGCHLIATGDVVTIAPKVPDVANGIRPTQACVRYAATDGFSSAIGPPPIPAPWDTYNGFFAFSEELPASYAPGTFEILCWPCWSPTYDISLYGAMNNIQVLPKFLLPWGNAWATDFAASDADDRLLFVGADDDRTAPIRFNLNPADDTMAGVIDAIQAGSQWGWGAYAQGTVFAWTPANPSNVMAPVYNGLSVQATTNVFIRERGLALIGGEVFAYYRTQSNDFTKAQIIGRALLGSQMLAHTTNEPIINLPIGPVETFDPAQAGQQILPTRQGAIYLTGGIDAPAALFCDPDGSKLPAGGSAGDNVFEFIGLPGRKTAPWLRGMYNSKINATWEQSNNLMPLVIGWWPRYASALPGESSDGWTNLTTADEQSALMRCRQYAWAGFPLRFYESYFDATKPLADLTPLSLPSLFTLEARALSKGFDWPTQTAIAIPNANVGTPTDLRGAFTNKTSGGADAEQFTTTDTNNVAHLLPTDGAELRVMWRYAQQSSTNLSEVSGNANKAPMIGPVHLRCQAPSKILQVETAR